MNIIYILLDQVRKDMLGAYGHHIVKTPNIDRLAKDGGAFLITPLRQLPFVGLHGLHSLPV